MDFHHSLAFGGGVVFVATFWLSYVVCVGAELYWNFKLQPKDTSRIDRGSYGALVISVNIAFALDFASAIFLPYGVIVTVEIPAICRRYSFHVDWGCAAMVRN